MKNGVFFCSISEQQDVISDMQRRYERDRNILQEENKKLQVETEKVRKPRAVRRQSRAPVLLVYYHNDVSVFVNSFKKD
jgi:hypothetical protein